MIWDVAAGVIIGGIALKMILAVFDWKGVGDDVDRNSQRYREGKEIMAFTSLISLVGVALAVWVIFFKAHW